MFTASITNNGDSRYYVKTKDYAFDISTEGQGAHPVDTVLAGLCGCVGHFAREYMKGESIPYQELSVKAEAELAESPNRLSSIDLQIVVTGSSIIDGHRQRLFNFIQNCPVYGTLSMSSVIRCSLVAGGDPGQ